jgi:hypothetical protein
MKHLKFVEIDGTQYALPAGMSDSKLAELAGALLLLQRIDYCSSKDYRKSFHFRMEENVRVRIGNRDAYLTEAEASAARDAYNATLPEPVTA